MDESVIEKVWDRLRHGIERIYNRPDEFSRKSRLDSISMYVLPFWISPRTRRTYMEPSNKNTN